MAVALIRIPPSILASSSSHSATACRHNNNSSRARLVVLAEAANSKSSGGTKKQQLRTKESKTTSPSCPLPLHAAEDIASRLGFEMAVADLERLFRKASFGHGEGGVPPDAGDFSGRPVRVAYQGVRGSYCQEAAVEAFTGADSSLIPCTNMEDAFSSLEDLSADRAVVPAENSLDGPIDRNLDLLLRHPTVRIVGELVLPVNHCLLSLPGAPASGLRRVVSHPQALSHCRRSLEALGLEVDEVSNAADAALLVAENRIADTAVIGSRIAANEFGLQILRQNFQDDQHSSFNRFLQLGRAEATAAAGAKAQHKTTVAFSLERGVKDLFRAMWAFQSRGVKVTRLDQRPNRSRPIRLEEATAVARLDYVFVLEVEGSDSDPTVKAAVSQLGEIAQYVRLLGTYHAASC